MESVMKVLRTLVSYTLIS